MRLGLNAELAVDKVVESGFSSLPGRPFNSVGSMGSPRGVAAGVLTVRLWKSVVAGGRAVGVVGTKTATGVVGVGVTEVSIIVDGVFNAGAVIAGTAVAVAAGGH